MFKNIIYFVFSKLVKLSIVETHTLNTAWITPGGNILDLGANHGAFSHNLSERFDSHLYLVEANPNLANELKQNPKFNVLHAAASGKLGRITFNISSSDDASTINSLCRLPITASVIVDGLNYAEILKYFDIQTVDVLKVDVEGAEIDFIAAMSDQELLAIKQITIEFHDRHQYYPYETTMSTINRLVTLGFSDMSMVNNTLDVLLVNNKLCESLVLERLRLKLLTKPFLKVFWTTQNYLISRNILYK